MGGLIALTWPVFGFGLLLVAYSSEDDQHYHNTKDDTGDERRGKPYKLQSETDFVKGKWNGLFKILDLNHDRVVNKDDMAIQQNVFISVYKLEGSEAHGVKQQLSTVWSCLTFDQLDKRLTKKQLLELVFQSIKRSKVQTKAQIHACAKVLAAVVDQNQDDFLALNELNVFYKSINQGNKKLARESYRKLCSDTEKPCPLDGLSDIITEIFIGDDQECFEWVKEIYENVGMPWEDFVE